MDGYEREPLTKDEIRELRLCFLSYILIILTTILWAQLSIK